MLLLTSLLTTFVILEAIRDKSSKDDLATDYLHCDRRCRSEYGCTERSIVGQKTVKSAPGCRCFNGSEPMGKELSWSWEPSLEENTWCGIMSYSPGKFRKPAACAKLSSHVRDLCIERTDLPGQHTMLINTALCIPETKRKLHCGKCGACSSAEDIEVSAKTYKWALKVADQVGFSFAAPWGHQDVNKLAPDLKQLGLTFTASCMGCWTDRLLCLADACKDSCWYKSFRISSGVPQDAQDRCLKCEERSCSPDFFRCSGADPTGFGLKIRDLPDSSICKNGLYSKSSTPTDIPQAMDEPSVQVVAQVLGKTTHPFKAQHFRAFAKCCCFGEGQAPHGSKPCTWITSEGDCPRILTTDGNCLETTEASKVESCISLTGAITPDANGWGYEMDTAKLGVFEWATCMKSLASKCWIWSSIWILILRGLVVLVD